MAHPRIKIVSDGTARATQVLFAEHNKWVNISGVVSEIDWHLKAGSVAEATIHIALPMLEAAAENVQAIVNGILPSITAYPVRCECGWLGSVAGAIPDIDGDGSLGCADCGRVLDSRMGN